MEKDNSIPDGWYEFLSGKGETAAQIATYLTDTSRALSDASTEFELQCKLKEEYMKKYSDAREEIKILEEREVLWENKQAMLNDEIDRLKERCIYLAGEIDDRNRLIEQLKINYKESITRD